ncbi:MAG: hypothetical protein KC800_03315 [Candidatus Eremiobacteraeota bacterium]|nr:hypothetical protein [Candidatus Eremiobacteraeota bacterium]
MASTITLPTARDRDLGMVLLFVSAATYFAVPPLAYQFGLNRGLVAAYSAPLGVVMMVVGLACIFASRKRITVEGGEVSVKDGFFSKPLRLKYAASPTFRLSGFEDEGNGRSSEVWTVHMVDEGKQYLVDRRVGDLTSSRSLAERLAKAARGSVVETHNGKSYEFSTAELDLSFVERVHRYPEMLGQEVPEPSDKVVHFERTDSGVKIEWSLMRSGILFELFCVSAFLFAAAFVPLPGGPDGTGFSLYDAEVAQGDYSYFIGVAAFTLFSVIVAAGYRNTLEVIIPKRAQSRTTIWGIPVRGGRIALEELEHVAVSVTSRGPYLQLISDKRILKERLPATNIARWIGWEIRRRLAETTPERTSHIEQSVEMDAF